MKYQVPLRWFMAADDEVRIVDERGRQAFRLDGEPVRTTGAGRATAGMAPGGRRLSFRDRRGDELAFVTRRQLPGTAGSAYEIYHGDDLQAVVRRDGCVGMRCRFMAEGPGPDDLHAEGDLGGREYSFTREGRTVGRVSRRGFGPGNYGVEVGRGEDEVLLLASAVVIDLCCQPDAEHAVPDPRMAG
jgi:uncharacterized protein YxjI